MPFHLPTTIGCAVTALGYVLMALPTGINEFSIMAYLCAAGLVVSAAAGLTPFPRPIALSGHLVAAIATLDIVRLLIGTTIDFAAFLLFALGLAALSRAAAIPASRIRHAVPLGAAGAATYLIHDVAVGYTQQVPADLLLAAGFLLLWIGTNRPTDRTAGAAATSA